MNSKNGEDSQVRIRKATEILQKIWWFSFYIIISPFGVAVVSYSLFFYLFRIVVFVSLSLAVISYMFALLFFYKAFDKYRNNPFFLNKENNLVARVHIVFLIPLLSCIVTPLFVLLSPKNLSFVLLPLIGFALLYNVVYFYFYFQPIDFYNIAEGEFKRAINLKVRVMQPYNLVVVFNYIFHLVFFSFTYRTELSWLFVLGTNLILYIITYINTKKISSNIRDIIKEKKTIIQELTKFKQNFVLSITTLIFILVIQIPLIFVFSRASFTILNSLNAIFLSCIFILFYFKSRVYVKFHYSSKINIYLGSTITDNSREGSVDLDTKYQKYNTLVSGLLIGLITAFGFLINNHLLIVIILPFFFIFSYYEEKAKVCPKRYNRYILLLNSIVMLITISFGLLSEVIYLKLQFLTFFLSLYFVLQGFVHFKYFTKEKVFIYQNVLAVASFTIILYSFFGFARFQNSIVFKLTLFSSDPVIIIISNILLHAILILSILLINLYIYYSRVFYPKYLKNFRRSISSVTILIELLVFILISIRLSLLVHIATLINILLFSSSLLPIIFLFFAFINYIGGVFSRKTVLVTCFYAIWILIISIFISLFLIYFQNYMALALDFLFLSIFSQLNLKLGVQIEKVKDQSLKRFTKFNSYLMILEFSVFLFFLFYSFILTHLVLYESLVLSVFFSLLITTILGNFLVKAEVVFSSSKIIIFNVVSLVFGAGLACYYSILYTLPTLYVILYPFIILFAILFFPIYYLFRKQIYEKTLSRLLIINLILIAIFISLIPGVSSFELYRLGQPFEIISVIIYSLLLFPSTFMFINFLSYVLKVYSREKFFIRSYFILWFLICAIFIVIFIVSLFNFLLITLDLLFLSIFTQLNLQFGLKLEKIKESSVKQFARINSYIITAELTVLFFFFFYYIAFPSLILYENIVLSIYCSLIITSILSNVLSKKEIVFTKSITIKLNVISLIFSASLTFYYTFIYTFPTFYVLLIPFLCFFTILLFPIYYLFKQRIFPEHIQKILILDCIIIAALLTTIPTIVSLDLYVRVGLLIDIISILNYTLFISFGLLIVIYFLLKHYNMKEKYKNGVLKSQIFIQIIIAGTTVFYYLYTIIPGFISRYHFPLIAASCFFYLPTIFAHKKRYFNVNLVKKTILGNSILLSGLVILIPSVIGFDLARIGFFIDILVITAITLTVIFVMLKYLDLIGSKLNLIEKRVKLMKLLQAITWLCLSTFVAYVIFSYFPTDISISSSLLIFFLLNIYTVKLLHGYSKELRVLDYLRECIFYGIFFSLSYLILSSIVFSGIFNLLPLMLKALNLVWYLGIFSLFNLLLIRYLGALIKFKFTKVKNGIELIFWGVVKIIVSFSISYFLSYSIITLVVLFSLVFVFLTPTTLLYFKKLQFYSEKNQLIIKKITLGIFIVLISVLYFEFLYNVAQIIPLSNFYTALPFTIIPTNIYLFLYYCLQRFNRVIEKDSNSQQYLFQLSSLVLFLSLFFMNFQIPLNILILIPFFLILTKRSIVVIYRFLAYVFLSYGLLIALQPLVMLGSNLDSLSYFTQFYLVSLSIVLLFSIWLNRKKNNNLEKYSLYISISLVSFIFLYYYTKIPLLYNITISLFLFLAFMGIYLYRQRNALYKWFIRPCALLLIFDFISFISYSLLFNNPQYINFSPILTFTLTMTITGFAFVFLYNKSPANFRKKSFYFILIAIILCFPAFLYFFLIASFSITFTDPIPIIVAINVAVFLYYLCVGIYQWRISWAIWKSGWYAWNILPIANWLIIYQSLRGIDVLTNSIKLFGIWDLTGASILAFIICTLFFLPAIYTKIKKYFLKIIFFVWAESLFLLFWVSQNLFQNNQLLQFLSFGLFAVILLLPFIVGIKYWKIASVIWLILTTINFFFLSYYLSSLGIVFEITISIDILVVGLLLIVYSFFPNIRSIGIILIISYSIVLIGIFVTIYFVLYSIILDPIFSLNIGLLVMGFSLFSSKYLKLKNRSIDLALSWLLIFNFSWLTFNTFSLFRGFELFAFFLALTVFGGTFFIFNHYKMKFRLNKIFPYSTIAIGASSSISSLFSTLFNLSLTVSIGIFMSVFIVFFYFILIEYRYILWFLIPIPITSFIFEFISSFELGWILSILILSIIYLSSFMILINIFKNFAKTDSEDSLNSLFKLFRNRNQVKKINLNSFLLNSFFISIFLAILLPFLLQKILFTNLIFVYQVLYFLIIWPNFVLISLKYIEKSEMDIKIKDPLLIFNRICIIIYLLIPFSSALVLFLLLTYLQINMTIIIFSTLLTLSGVVFIESYIIDRHLFYYLFNSLRNKFIFWSWSAFINIICIFFYFFHSNLIFLILTISIFNQISLYFLSYLDVSKEKISIGRMILLYTFFVSGSFYLSFLISNGLVILFNELKGITYYTLLIQNSFLLLFISSYFFIRFKTKLKYSIELIFFIIFQGSLALNWILICMLLNILNLFSVTLLVIVETIFCYRTFKYFNLLFFQKKRPKFLANTVSTIIILLYFELSLVIYGFMIIFLGIIESILVSQLVFFALTLLEIYAVKKLKSGYAQLFHTISFFIISLMILFIVNQFASYYPILLSLEALMFILMQFYTNHSFFKALSSFYEDKVELITKCRVRIKQILGIAFYGNLLFILLQSLIMLNLELQMILLSMSLLVHVLMILDTYLLKFLGKVASYLRVISWVLIMVFTTSYLLWFYFTYLIQLLITSIPLIVFILLLETVYLFKLLDFWKVVISNKQKIRSYLIRAFYIDFIIWPMFYATVNLFRVLNLLILCLGIMFILTYVDIKFKVIREKRLINLRKGSFLMIGLLLSIDTFILLEMVPTGSLLLSLSTSLLIFIIFFAIIIKPFKRHPIVPFLFWIAIFSLLSSVIYHFSLSWEISVSVLSIIVLIYPFIFLLEELRKLFSKFLEYLMKFLRILKQSIINAIKKIYHFVKTHFLYIWIPFSAFLAILTGILLSPVILNLLNWGHTTLLMFAIFGLLFLVIPSKDTTDAGVIFKRRISRLSIGWGSAISLLFILITPVWYIFTVLISIAVVGTITLVYLGRKEEREKISIKWRFYTLLILFILLIFFTGLFIYQLVFWVKW